MRLKAVNAMARRLQRILYDAMGTRNTLFLRVIECLGEMTIQRGLPYALKVQSSSDPFGQHNLMNLGSSFIVIARSRDLG